MASVEMVTPAGSNPLISLMRLSSCVLVAYTSTSQVRYTSITQEPRLVLLLTMVTPFTRFTADSSGLVTVIIIRSTGCCPLSAMSVILGKVTSGNSAVCIRW